MKRILLVAMSVIFASAISATANSSRSLVKVDALTVGLDPSIVETLTQDQIDELARVIHDGDDSEAHKKVRSLLLRFKS